MLLSIHHVFSFTKNWQFKLRHALIQIPLNNHHHFMNVKMKVSNLSINYIQISLPSFFD